MTLDQKLAALVAITMRLDAIRSCINENTSMDMIRHTTKWLEDLEGAYNAIDAIDTE